MSKHYLIYFRYNGIRDYPDGSRVRRVLTIVPTPDCPYFTWEFLGVFDLEEQDTVNCFVRFNDHLSLYQNDVQIDAHCGMGLAPTGYSSDNVNPLEVRFGRNGKQYHERN